MDSESIIKKFGGLLKNKYAVIILAVGLIILLIPSGTQGTSEKSGPTDLSPPQYSIQEEENRLCQQLAKIDGAGEVSVLLSVEGSVSRQLADNGEETLVISRGSDEQVVELYYVNPRYLGAVIVCEGASASKVRLEITKAVSAFTGLGADKIRVVQMV